MKRSEARALDVLTSSESQITTWCMQTGIGIFCVLFAVNSSIHSYLVLRYAEGNKTAINVGFYYMSNAAGRLIGTMLSGLLYTYAGSTRAAGFGWCFVLSAAFLVLCCGITSFVRDDDEGLACGPCLVCVGGVARTDRAGVDAGGSGALAKVRTHGLPMGCCWVCAAAHTGLVCLYARLLMSA
jgi:hypothetical protein